MGALPPGVTVDQAPPNVDWSTAKPLNQAPDTGLPPGVTVDPAPPNVDWSTAKPFNASPAEPGVLEKIGQAAENFAIGAGKSAGETLNDIGGLVVNPIYKAVTGKEAPPSSIPPVEGTAQKVGAFGEQVAEWLGGEEALKGLALLDRFPTLAKLIAKAPDAPAWAKGLLQAAVRSGAVGSVEGLLHPAGETPAKAAVSGAAGGAIGGALGEGITKALPEIPGLIHGRLTPEELESIPGGKSFQPAANLTNKEVLNFAANHDVKLTPGEASQSKFRTGLEGLGRRVIGSSYLEDRIEQSRNAFAKVYSDFLNRLDPAGLGASEESTGGELQRSVAAAKNSAKAAVHSAYGTLSKGLQDVVVDTRPIRDEWLSRLNSEKDLLEILPPEAKSELEKVYKLGSSLGTVSNGEIVPRMSFANAVKLRSVVGDLGSTPGAQLADRVEGLYKNLYGDLTDAMDHAADSAGFGGEWKQANAVAKQFHADFGDRQSPLYRILSQKDPAVSTRTVINRMSAHDLETLQRTGVDLAPLRRFVADDIAKSGYRVNTHGLGGYSDSFLTQLFGADKRELYRAAALGRRLGFEVNPSGTSNVLANEWALSQLSQVAGTAGGVLMGHPATAAGSVALSAIPVVGSFPRDVSHFLPRAVSPAAKLIQAGARAAGGTLGRIIFRASDGSVHSIPADQLGAARQIDPDLQVIR